MSIQEKWEAVKPERLKMDHVRKMAKRGIHIDIDKVTPADVEYRRRWKIISNVLYHYENECLKSFEATCKLCGWEVDTLMFDGLHVRNDGGATCSPDELMNRMVEACVHDTMNHPSSSNCTCCDREDPEAAVRHDDSKPYFDLTDLLEVKHKDHKHL